MENEKKAMVVVQLNIDVIVEILSRLRVKDLLRFKTVCKAWLQLISSQDFIKIHLQRSSFRPISLKRTYFLVDCHRGYPSGWRIFCGSSCDGLLCLFYAMRATIHTWNPALRSLVCIPIKKCPHNITFFWFGLHNDDYKLVLGTHELEMHVVRPYIDTCYSWKSTQKLDGYSYDCETGTFFDGHVHWPVHKVLEFHEHWTILSYDLHHEKVGEIAIPVDIRSSAKFVRLGEVDECLSALVSNGTMEFELWAMKEYGVEKSWIKMRVLNAETLIPFHGTHSEEVVLDDPTAIKSPLYGKEVYVESLVSPKLFTERLLRNQKKSCQIIGEM